MFWAALLAGTLGTLLQQPAVDDPSVVIRSTTSLVQVRVVVRDAKGKAVSGLRREDFQVFDDRKPQPISLFSAETSPGSRVAASQSSAEPADDTARASSGYSLIVMDWTNTEYPDRYRAKDMALRLLRSYQPRQKVAIYLNGRNSRLLCDFTTDMAELAHVLEEADLEFADINTDPTISTFDARYGAKVGVRATVEEQFFFWNKRITDTLRTLGLLADRLARLPGRKSLVWMSDAFPLVINGSVIRGASALEGVYYPDFERTVARLNRADVAVYGVDAQGLSTVTRSFSPTMIQFAERTGGTAFYDRNDLDEGIRLAMEDMNASYVLAFHVPPGAAAGPHEIRVRVNHPHLTLRYRESYQLVF